MSSSGAVTSGLVIRPIAQHEPLTVRLRNLVQGYPKGFGIVKEFLQNADDAGASAMEIVMDWRVHPSSRLPAPALARLCGPALLVVNDAVFTDPDFRSILALGESGKRLDSAKIGKFGLGFNAAYNVTDHPCMVSRDRLYILDPHRSAVAGLSPKEGVDFELNSPLWKEAPDLLLPFAAGGLDDGETDLHRTIFRLPLRTADRARESEISKEPFTAGDFQEIVSQLEARAAELLIFLRHVLSLRVSEIPPEGGPARELLHVETGNRGPVAAAREVVGRWLGGTQAEVLSSLRAPGGRELAARYEHHVRVTTPAGSATTRWFVVNGLHTGPHDELLDLADAILLEGDRALPLAGAAARLEGAGPGRKRVDAVEGRVFCGLPLPHETPLAIHLNGFFELDGNRDWLKGNTESIGSHERHRRQWNRELVRHGLAAATVALLDSLAEEADAEGVGDLYALWPKADAALSTLLPGFCEAVYRAAWTGDHPFIRVENPAANRVKPRDALRVPAAWHPRLAAPLAQAGFNIPHPPLPPHIALGFHVAGHPLAELTPKELRKRWRTSKDINVEPANAPNPAWREREWVMELLSFVVSDGAGDLKGVPLALLADGKLHTFGHSTGNITFIASDLQRAVFAPFPHWFVDAELVERCGLAELPAAGVLRMTPDHVLRNLDRFLATDRDRVAWSPQGEKRPNAVWLTSVFEYLAAEGALASDAGLGIFRRLALVPDQFGQLSRPGLRSTPLWPIPDRAGRPQLRKVFGVLGVPLVKGPSGLARALRAALAHSKSPLVGEVTGPGLVDAVSETIQRWDGKALTYHPDIHDALLDFLASQEPSRYSDEQVERLRRLRIFPTQSGELVSLADADPVLPADTRFPAVPGMLLLKPGGAKSWRSLFKRLGVGTLNYLALAERILELDFRPLRRDRRYRLLVWLRTHLDRVLADAGQDREALLRRLRGAAMVQGDDGGLHAAAKLYDRDALIAREVLGPLAVFPDFARTYAQEPDLWQAFFLRLGSPADPRPEDVLAHLDRLIGEAGGSGADAVAERLLSLFEYVRDHWRNLAAVTVLDPVSGAEGPLPEALGRRAWLPARRAPERLQNFAGYVVPESRLYRPGELYEAYQGHLVASRAPIAPFLHNLTREVREGLGFPGAPPLELVLDHFDHLLDLWDRGGHGGLDARKLVTSLNAIYRDLGNRLGSAEVDSGTGTGGGRADRETILSGLRERFAERACLWDEKRQRFWLPAHAFAEAVPFFGGARATLVYNEAPINAAYEVLGRRAAVGAADLTAFLAECAAAHAGGVLPEPERANVLLVLRRLAEENRQEGAALESCPLLSEDGRLLHPSMLFEDDDPYHRPFLHEGGVHMVDPGVPVSLCQALGVPSLDRTLEERMAGEPPFAHDAALGLTCRRIASTLHSGEFASGLLRLLRHRRADGEGRDLAWLRRLEVVPTLAFDVELWLPGEQERRVGTMEGSFFFECSAERVYVAADSGEFVRHHLAHAIDRRLGGAIGDLSALVFMLECEPARIDTLLTKLRIARVRNGHDAPREEWPAAGTDQDASMAFAPDVGEEDAMGEASLDAGSHAFAGPEPHDEGWEEADGAPGYGDRDEAAYGPPAPSPAEAEASGGGWNDREGATGGPAGDPAHAAPDAGPGTNGHPVRPLTFRAGHPSSAPPAPDPEGRPARADLRRPGPRPLPEPVRAHPDTNGRGVEPPSRSAPGASAPGASRRRPPGDPGSGSWKSRVVTYLQPRTQGAPDPGDASDDELPQNRHIGEAAEAFAHEEERRTTDRVVTRMPHNNPGFDILSESADGADQRFIEVKGIRGEWGGAGVPLSARQFEMAWQKREAFWVYVVEYALDPARRRMTRIRNPAGYLTEYRLDHHWRELGV
ncbi:MAG: DUF3883 domain-containing protein [Longimicrobiaceae bacterium]